MPTLLRAAGFATALLVVAGCATQKAQPALSGAVRDAGGGPAAGTWVSASPIGGTWRTSVRTDARGRYGLALAPGRYLVTAASGASVASPESVDVGAAGSDARSLDLTLGAPSSEPAAHPSATWLALLPDGVEKRQFILDCTGCHQFNETRVYSNGQPRTRERWTEDVARMLTYAGAGSGFPVIAAHRQPDSTASWLSRHLVDAEARIAAQSSLALPEARAEITEYDMPVPQDLPHDLAVGAGGHVIVTGMFTHRMFRVDPATGAVEQDSIPVAVANPRAVELDDAGNWWVLLGRPGRVARRDAGSGEWTSWPIGMYPHSIAPTADGRFVWFNGHFTRDPELIGRLDVARDTVETFVVPRHAELADSGGPVPYEQRLGPDGTVWFSELQGNRILAFDPARQAFKTHVLPTSWSGPRRFDVAPDGTLWIPAYAANLLVRFDPRSGRFEEHPLPVSDALPYIARVHPTTGDVWIGTAAADAVIRFQPGPKRFSVYPVPTRGATMRHMAIDAERGDVWLAYGASPAIHPARIARLRVVQ